MIDLSHLGLTSQVLTEQSLFKPAGDNLILLYDGDGACYESSAGVAKPETALKRLRTDIYKTMYLAGCTKARVHLTPSGCFKNGRHLLLGAKKYQETRSNNKKPAFLNYLRSQASVDFFADDPDVEIILNYKIEADDALMIDHHVFSNGILVSPDKDLNISPFKSYHTEKGKYLTLPEGDTFGWIDREEWFTPSMKPASKMIGKGSKFFLAQMLMGDTADNVKGILKYKGKLCGEAAAFEALKDITDKHEAVNLVIEAYKAIDQNPVPEAEAMWLLRNHQDNSLKFFLEHDLTDSNKDFLLTCWHDRKWKLTEDDLEYDDAC